jgi:hypothetical protein
MPTSCHSFLYLKKTWLMSDLNSAAKAKCTEYNCVENSKNTMYTYIVRSSQLNLLTLLETSSSLCSSSYFLNLPTQSFSIKLGALAVLTMAACVELCNQEKTIFFCSSGMESSPYPRRASKMLAWHQMDFHRAQYNMDTTLKQSCSVLIVHPYWNEVNLYQLTNSQDRWFTNFKAIAYFQLFVAKISQARIILLLKDML